MRWRKIIIASTVLSLSVAAVVFGPLVAQKFRQAHANQAQSAPPSLQSLIESGEIRHLESTASIAHLLPYDSISLETSPCFGDCQIFLLTFYRDGRATLITDHFLPKERKRFTGKLWAQEYARLTQLISLAQASAKESHYAGTWTDDSSSTIRATENGKAWEVSDYGGVSPPEVWALDIVMTDLKDHIEWVPARGG